MAPFEYKPIDLQGRSFRLVQLFKAEYGPVRCELFDARLDDEEDIIDYEALSYTWGGTYKPHEIEINGRILPVTKNLSLALRSLRYPHQDRILWIDAICIDQNNDRERGHQVLQMASIYKKAEQVIIWLGPATTETDLVFNHMSQFEKESVKHVCKDWKVSDERWVDLWDSVQPPSDDRESKLISRHQQQEGLTELLTRSWFDRVWIIQEVVNARAAKVTCGTKSVSARIFALSPFLVGLSPNPHCQAILDVMPGPTRKYSWWTQNQDLYTLLLKFRGSEASDPRDKIYALLGISSDAFTTGFLKPDYEKSEVEVIQDTVAFLLQFNHGVVGTPCSPDWTLTEFLQSLELLGENICVWAAGSGNEAIVTLLLNTGTAHVDFKNKNGQTPLLMAAENGHEAIVRLLLDTGMAEINIKSKDGRTPLLLAAENGHNPIVKQLLDIGTADSELKDLQGWMPLWTAAINGYDEIVKMLLDYSPLEADTSTLAHEAALEANKVLASELLKTHQANGSSKGSSHGQKPLWWAVQNNYTTLVEMFLKTGIIDLDSVSEDLEKLLVWTAHNGYETSFKLLLNEVKVDIVDTPENRWASHLLIWASETGDDVLVKLLLDTGRFDIFFKGWNGHQLLSRAADKGQEAVVKLLLNTEGCDDLGRGIALWMAADSGHESTVRLLLDTGGIDVNFKLRDNQTPLWRAAWGGHTAVVKLLLSTHNVEVDSKNDLFQQTPLSMAAEKGHIVVVQLLLDTNSVEVSTKDRDGCTPLVLATKNKHKAVARLLETYMEPQ
jgi:ankyrin repeat protein